MSDEENTPDAPGSFWEHVANAVGALRRAGAQRDANAEAEREAKAAARARAKANAPVVKMTVAGASSFAEKRDSKAACCIASRKLKGESGGTSS